MKHLISKSFYFIIGSFLFIVACTKTESTPKTKSDIIVTTTWKYSSAGIDLDANGTIDQPAPTALVQPCLTDNTLTFKADKTGTIDEGASKCDPATAQLTPFTWALSSNDTQLTLSTPILAGFGNDAKVVELSESKLILARTVIYSGLPIPIVVILVH